jgi:hypothetical protein
MVSASVGLLALEENLPKIKVLQEVDVSYGQALLGHAFAAGGVA